MKFDQDIERTKKIEKQVERWDLFAKIVPTLFLITCFGLLSIGSISFETVFYWGMILFAFTAVTWWFWTIFSIRYLVNLLNKSSKGLIEVTNELKIAREEIKALTDDENNSS